tara:strand:- start:2975 stop:3136 length:162 start_codon:yes stop_codon:yes gene_type:complete
MVDIVRTLLGLDQPEKQTKRHKPASKSGRSQQRSKQDRKQNKRLISDPETSED